MVNNALHKKHILLLHSNMHLHSVTATVEVIRHMKHDLLPQPHTVQM